MAKLEVRAFFTDRLRIYEICYGDDLFKITKTDFPVKDVNGNWIIKAECKEYSMIFELAFNPKTLLFELLDIKKL